MLDDEGIKQTEAARYLSFRYVFPVSMKTVVAELEETLRNSPLAPLQDALILQFNNDLVEFDPARNPRLLLAESPRQVFERCSGQDRRNRRPGWRCTQNRRKLF